MKKSGSYFYIFEFLCQNKDFALTHFKNLDFWVKKSKLTFMQFQKFDFRVEHQDYIFENLRKSRLYLYILSKNHFVMPKIKTLPLRTYKNLNFRFQFNIFNRCPIKCLLSCNSTSTLFCKNASISRLFIGYRKWIKQ
jgi:hypothetical protein